MSASGIGAVRNAVKQALPVPWTCRDERTHPNARTTNLSVDGHGLRVACAVLLGACGGGADGLPQLSEATGASLSLCTDLASKFSFANTTIKSAVNVEAGTLQEAGTHVAAHCLVKGEMYRRTSPVDGQNYAVGFEMRLPVTWNGRFFYQANGGIDGFVAASAVITSSVMTSLKYSSSGSGPVLRNGSTTNRALPVSDSAGTGNVDTFAMKR